MSKLPDVHIATIELLNLKKFWFLQSYGNYKIIDLEIIQMSDHFDG